jgi:hypothetical protein
MCKYSFLFFENCQAMWSSCNYGHLWFFIRGVLKSSFICLLSFLLMCFHQNDLNIIFSH